MIEVIQNGCVESRNSITGIIERDCDEFGCREDRIVDSVSEECGCDFARGENWSGDQPQKKERKRKERDRNERMEVRSITYKVELRRERREPRPFAPRIPG